MEAIQFKQWKNHDRIGFLMITLENNTEKINSWFEDTWKTKLHQNNDNNNNPINFSTTINENHEKFLYLDIDQVNKCAKDGSKESFLIRSQIPYINSIVVSAAASMATAAPMATAARKKFVKLSHRTKTVSGGSKKRNTRKSKKSKKHIRPTKRRRHTKRRIHTKRRR